MGHYITTQVLPQHVCLKYTSQKPQRKQNNALPLQINFKHNVNPQPDLSKYETKITPVL